MNTFRLQCGRTDAGWSSFHLTLKDRDFQCEASYLGAHPVCSLLPIVVSLHTQECLDYEQEASIYDEPGGFRLTFRHWLEPEADPFAIRVTVYPLSFAEVAEVSDLSADLKTPLYSEIFSWNSIAEAVYEAACIVLKTHGIYGFRSAWKGARWDCDSMFTNFPMEHFLYLSRVVNGIHLSNSNNLLLSDLVELCRLLPEKERQSVLTVLGSPPTTNPKSPAALP